MSNLPTYPSQLEAFGRQLGASIVQTRYHSVAIGFKRLCDAKRFYDAASGMGYDTKLLTCESVMFKRLPMKGAKP